MRPNRQVFARKRRAGMAFCSVASQQRCSPTARYRFSAAAECGDPDYHGSILPQPRDDPQCGGQLRNRCSWPDLGNLGFPRAPQQRDDALSAHQHRSTEQLSIATAHVVASQAVQLSLVAAASKAAVRTLDLPPIDLPAWSLSSELPPVETADRRSHREDRAPAPRLPR